MATGRSSGMIKYINYRMRVTVEDSRYMIGTFLAFDKYMNLVLADCEEYRRIKVKKGASTASEEREEKRTLGLVLLRGESVVSMSVEGPPPPDEDDKVRPGGPGTATSGTRGLNLPPANFAPRGLTGAVPGIGTPSMSMMQPQMQIAVSSQPQTRTAPVIHPPFAMQVEIPPPPGVSMVPPGGSFVPPPPSHK